MAQLSFAGKEFKLSYKKLMLIIASLIIFAILDELHQKLIPGRAYSIRDIASNVTGILAATIFTLIAFRVIRNSVKKSSKSLLNLTF